MIMLAYYCMPQVFFYGVHVMAGQVLNARDRFGPMMWAPIANSVVSIVGPTAAVLDRLRTHQHRRTRSLQVRSLLLGLGSTLGIAAQACTDPFMQADGYHFRPRFDFKNTGLGKTFRLAKWTLGFVLVTQAAFVVVTKLAGGATVGRKWRRAHPHAQRVRGVDLPHSLITVSLACHALLRGSPPPVIGRAWLRKPCGPSGWR